MADVLSPVTGSISAVNCAVGDQVKEGDELVLIESMKMEVPVEAPAAGTVTEVLAQVGQTVNEGDRLLAIS